MTPTRPQRRRGRGQRGFTLAEVMISVALLAMVTVGLTMIVVTAGRSRDSASRVALAQTGVRASMEFLTRDVQMASAGARSGTIVMSHGGPAQRLPVVVTNSSTGTDRLELILVDGSAQTNLIAAYNFGGLTLQVADSSNFNFGDKVQVSDLSAGFIMTVNGIGPNTIGVSAPANPLPVPNYAAGAYVFRSKRVTYYVDTIVLGTSTPVLMLDPDADGPQEGQPLAEGVEDFQVALGIDANADGVISENGTVAGDDEWIFNVAGELAPPAITGLRSVRVTLVVRSTTPENGTRGQRPAAEDHPGDLVADGYPRRVIRSEITVRSFTL